MAAIGIPAPDDTVRPYSSLNALKLLRDEIAHARPEAFSETHVHPTEDVPFPSFRAFEGRITPQAARDAAADISAIADTIHAAAKYACRCSPEKWPVWLG